MKLTHEVSNLEKSAVCLTVTVSQKDVADTYNATMSKYTKNAMIPGFRKGHVPQSVLEKKYGTMIKEAAAMDIVDKSIREVFDAEDMASKLPLSYSRPALKNVPELNTAEDMTYSVTYDIFPEVGTLDVSGLAIKEAQVSVTDDDVKKALENLRERNAFVVDKAGDTVEKGDVVTMNYAMLDDDGAEVAGTKREDFTFTVGSKMNMFELDDEIVGLTKGETRKINKTYAADHPNKSAAGKTLAFTVTITAVKERKLPDLDDDFAQDVKDSYKTLSDLKEGVKKDLESAKDEKLLEMKKEELLKELIAKTPFDIPQSMLDMELNSRWDTLAQQYGTTPEDFERIAKTSGSTKEQTLKEWESTSTDTLKKQIIVSALVKSRNVSVTPEEVEAEYKKMAETSDAEVEDIKKYYEEPKVKEYLIDSIKEKKMFEALFKEIKVQKGSKMTLDELMK